MIDPDQSITHAFLKHVLPDQGLYAVAIFRPGPTGPRHYWTTSLQELARKILEEDAGGNTVYHACASYRERSNRKQANALGAKALWLDVDAGEEAQKKNPEAYKDATAAYYAVEAFCRATGLPSPTYVASGNGLHVYWVLLAILAPADWLSYAQGLKRLCAALGLHVGPERTADVASILRPPGTHHRKGEPKLIECGELTGPYEIERFEMLLNSTARAEKPKTINDRHNLGRRPALATALAATFDRAERFAEPIADSCAQLGALRSTRGNLAEPLWYAGLGVLAWCADGDELAHQWSSGYPGYIERETAERLDRSRQLSGATTCERFYSLNPKLCEACPHWRKIKSPISLGQNGSKAKDKTSKDQEGKSTQRERLILVGLSGELWHDSDHNGFATVKIEQHQENFPIKSTAFRHWSTREYGERFPMKFGDTVCPSAPSTQALTEAINALQAKAISGAERRPAIRIAEHNGLIYIDLGQPQWNAVEISSNGWRIVPVPPVRFVRPRGLRPLPIPVTGGCPSELREFVNVGSDADFVLVIGWLIAALRPTGPYPVLIVNGEHGAGKSIFCRVIRRLIDPNAAELRSEPRDERDLLLAAKNGWIVALDNLSYVKNDLSDAICRVATKGAFATRALYTDDEEFLLEVCRPVLLNGIPPLASRADLADRAVVLVLPNMDDTTRQTEGEFWEAFETAAPRIFGALIDGLSGALRCLPSIKLQTSTRMMDFAKFAEAACRGLGATPGTFEAAYAANRSSANEDALDADSVAGAVLRLMTKKEQFSGTATELLTALETYSPSNRQDRRWPKDATRLSGQLRRVAPLLRPRGIEINFDQRTPDAARNRLIEIKLVGPK